MNIQRGDTLSHQVQQQALRLFVHRYTKEHVPAWVRRDAQTGKVPPVHFSTDAEWLANTDFFVTKAGKLDQRFNRCETHAHTWPDGKEWKEVSAR